MNSLRPAVDRHVAFSPSHPFAGRGLMSSLSTTVSNAPAVEVLLLIPANCERHSSLASHHEK